MLKTIENTRPLNFFLELLKAIFVKRKIQAPVPLIE